MNTHELLEEATRRQIVALGGEPRRGIPPVAVSEGSEEGHAYLAIMGIEDSEAYLEWLSEQVASIVFSLGPLRVMMDPGGSMCSAFTAGVSLGYQLALIRLES